MASRRRQRGPRRPRLHLGLHRRVTPASTTRNRTRCRDSDDDDDGPPTNRARANSRPRRPRLHIGPDFLFTDRAGRRRGRAGRREGRGDLAGRALSIMTFGPQKLPEITKVMGISGNFPVITDPDFHYQEIGHPYGPNGPHMKKTEPRRGAGSPFYFTGRLGPLPSASTYCPAH